ncbi:hypothetical protein [Streptomyces roseicoloratus]|uniref:Uncharacterized protein n=1 Tax=Streptomyces roseicoloratus TaxID=2508722 RepID=A0ABY9RXK7_9ACTN|nr:hypothetical protein [Streptomyces roseicoloratus]WMX46697.1 hypothetical protein RGF97_20265 [Streptomyces roseicoloratus]
MGHARAYVVHRTADAAEAHACARRFRELLTEPEDTLLVEALVSDPERLRRVAAAVPGAWFEDARQRTYDPWGEPGEVSFPVWVCAEEAPREAELPFLRAVGEDPASVVWRGTWPGPDGAGHRDGVQVTFHSDDVELERAAPAHTVFLHVHSRCPVERVRELAALGGCEVLEGPRLGL